VIRSAARGDAARRRGPFPGGAPDPGAAGHLYLNTNKRGVASI
jgi:hypothetical protein